MAVSEQLDYVHREARLDPPNSDVQISTEQLLDELLGRFEDDDLSMPHLASTK